jgi:hypothetical protein
VLVARPVRPEEARRLLVAGIARLNSLTLEAFTPAWTRPRTQR